MVTIKNPFADWINKNQQKTLEAEVKSRIRISDYTDSEGNIFTALLVDGIFVKRVTKDNIQATEKQLKELRIEYINKHK
jgi:hypothetical protein